MENSVEIPQITENRTTISSNLTGIYLRKTESLIWKDTCTSMFIAVLRKQSQLTRQINKLTNLINQTNG